MKNTRKFISLILVLALCMSAFTTTNVEAKGKVKLNKKKITLTVGSKYELKLKNYKKKVRWKSSNKKVASVSKKGNVTAKKKGTAKITAIAGKKKYVCKVIVKKSKRSSDNQSTVIPSTVPAVTPAMPGDTVTVLPTIAPNNTPLATPSTVPSSTPVTTPTVAPSSTPPATPTAVPGSTPLATPAATPSSTPLTTPSATPAAMQDIPKFIGFKTYDDKELITEDSELTTLSTNEMLALVTPQTETAVTDTKSIQNNLINKKEMLLVKLSYENKKRDNIVEIVLNDSDYGKKQIYTTAASVNKILSSDTYYDEEKDSYITDVLLQMPPTKSESKRIIEVEETCFLRETVGVKGYADLSAARQTTVTFLVSEEPLPSYPQYFNFTENEEGGYTIVSWNQSYLLPDTVYIPPMYKGKPVNKLGAQSFDKATMSTLIIPETITEIGNELMNKSATALRKIFMLGNIPKLGSFGFDYEQRNDGKCQIIVPQQYALNYKYCSGTEWIYIFDLLYCFWEGKYTLLSEADIPVRKLPEPKIAINSSNEATATLNKTVYRTNLNWDSITQSVLFTSQGLDDIPSNGGIAFNLDNTNKSAVDVSEYKYVKLDIEAEAEVGMKLLQDSSSIWSAVSASFEGKQSSEYTGRRSIYLDVSFVENIQVSAILIFANKVNTPVKIYNIEFVTEKLEE